MDDPVRLRRKAARLRKTILIVLLLNTLVLLFFAGGMHLAGPRATEQHLRQQGRVLMGEFQRFYFGRGEELLAYPPPPVPDSTWARAIWNAFGQPVAVCVVRGTAVEWMNRPTGFAPGEAHLERFVQGGKAPSDHTGDRQVGVMRIQRLSFDGDSLSFKGWLVGRAGSDFRWGVVLNYWDAWPAFCARLTVDTARASMVHAPAVVLRDVFRLPGGPEDPHLIGLIIRQDDNILFRSPGVTVGAQGVVIPADRLQLEYYAGADGIPQGIYRRVYRLFLAALGFALLLMILFWRYTRLTRRLSAPASAAVPQTFPSEP